MTSLGGPLFVCGVDAFAHWGGAAHGPTGEQQPGRDFARAMAAVDDLEAAFVRFGDGEEHTGFLWETEGEGTAEVALADDGLLLLRSPVPPGRAELPRRHAAGASAAEEREWGGSSPSTAAMSWSPGRRWARTRTTWLVRDSPGASRGAARPHPAEPAGPAPSGPCLGVGTVLPLGPGTYRVTGGWHRAPRVPSASGEGARGSSSSDGGWNCSWVRFTRSGGTGTRPGAGTVITG
ncbi:hypothetical protein [Streptomyces clavuligerus]|uniref:hypothetical protein n=1 Tax=Streptomyces clavuligerus TaxID=1901 RepID=UPI00018009E1|nr:hypothetical protein SSCG_05440 [Streptomyces clavuligerus]